MRNLYEPAVDRFRRTHPSLGKGDETCGYFVVPSPIDSAPMSIIASQGGEWDHISVSRRNRPPNWPEMERVRMLFFGPNETVMQLHVPAGDHVNAHPNCLHLWRPQNVEIPRPPGWMVGPKNGQSVAEVIAEGRAVLGV